MKTKYLTSLLLLVVACSGGQTTGGGTGGESQAQLKKAAADAKANGSAKGDACAEHGWYGDGECDHFCQDVDSVDCTPNAGGEVVCALILENADGYCDPKRECIGQDPDCANMVGCTLILENPDGVCSRTREDPCIGQDPDCANVDPPSGPIAPPMPTPPGLICPAIALEANGVCDADFEKDPCLFYADPDCRAVDPLPPGDSGGTGSAGGSAPSDPGGTGGSTPSDPGGTGGSAPSGIACAAYVEQSDGECKREPTDPCIFQDPDCHVK
jgi:hypothetical protein